MKKKAKRPVQTGWAVTTKEGFIFLDSICPIDDSGWCCRRDWEKGWVRKGRSPWKGYKLCKVRVEAI